MRFLTDPIALDYQWAWTVGSRRIVTACLAETTEWDG
jgi:hypothetical protein